MTLASHAFAPEFTHTSATPDVTITFASGVSPVTASSATGTYRMWLTRKATCFPRDLTSRIWSAIALARGTAAAVTPTLSADGVFTMTFEVDIPATITFADGVWQRLGFASASPTLDANNAIVGARPVWHLALLSAATGPYWQPMQAGGAEQTTGGRVYAIASTLTSWQRSLKVHFQPTTPSLRAAHNCDATAMYPAEEYMGSLGSTATAREWSVLDVLYSARNALCGYTSTWGTARTTTSERIWRVYIGPEALLSTRTELLKAEWLAYCEWDLGLVAPSATPTETRA